VPFFQGYNPPVVVIYTLVMAFAVVVTIVDTIVVGGLGAILGFIPPRGDWTRRLARVWAQLILWSALIRVKVEGADRVPAGGPVVFMANHESWLDIPVLLVAIPGQVRFLAKSSLFSIPFLGWAMRSMGFIPVDRENRRTAVKSFEKAAARIRAGRSVLVFPEETRTSDGSLLPLQRGGFLIALKAALPIVPVGLDGARRCMPKYNYVVRPGKITVRFGEAIPTAGRSVSEKTALMETTRNAIAVLRGTPEDVRGAAPAAAAAETEA
jgi:1-acyl-sn-glycerol-3-phosphate acyltransferase